MRTVKSVLLIGLGRFGRHMAAKLQELHHEVLAVDKDEERVNDALPLVTHAQIGDSTSEAFIASLGVRNFDMCVVAIGDDFQSSLETTALLKEQGARYVLSRAARDVHAKFLLRNGADHIVYPTKQVAQWTAIRYTSDHIFNYVELDEDNAIVEVSVPDEWVGKTVGNLDIRRRSGVNVLGIKREGRPLDIAVSSNTVLTRDENLLVMGSNKAIQKCFHI